jgi:hypothetical protein
MTVNGGIFQQYAITLWTSLREDRWLDFFILTDFLALIGIRVVATNIDVIFVPMLTKYFL